MFSFPGLVFDANSSLGLITGGLDAAAADCLANMEAMLLPPFFAAALFAAAAVVEDFLVSSFFVIGDFLVGDFFFF